MPRAGGPTTEQLLELLKRAAAELTTARDEAARSTVVQSIAAYLRKAPLGADARQALDVLDKLGPLAPSVELVAAHAAVLANVPARAAPLSTGWSLRSGPHTAGPVSGGRPTSVSRPS